MQPSLRVSWCWRSRWQAPSAAQEEPSGISYITPFPEGDVYKLQAYGDGFAEGLLNGLVEAFAGDGRVQVSRKHRPLHGLTRLEFDDEMKAEESPGRETFHIGVVMIGLADRNHIRTSPRDRALWGTDEWRNEYGRRVDRFIKTLKKRGAAVYWVGQPVMRRPEMNEAAQTMNDIAREKTYLNGAKFIDIQAHFADEAGNYAPYGPDITGKQRLLREARRRAVHATSAIASLRISSSRRSSAICCRPRTSGRSPWLAARPSRSASIRSSRVPLLRRRHMEGHGHGIEGRQGRTAEDPPPQVREAPVADTSNDQRADNGRITLKSIGAGGREESVTIDILRPAIPSAVIALMTRKDTGDRPSQMGDVVADEVGGGLVALSSITPSGVGPGTTRRVTAPSLSPYYTVLIKGERPMPKPGRADDFSWPRVDPQIVVEPPAPAQRLPRRAQGGDRRAVEAPSHLGRSLRPIRKRSMACAAWRPSRIAHTTSDCPRRMSPAAKTFWLPLMR